MLSGQALRASSGRDVIALGGDHVSFVFHSAKAQKRINRTAAAFFADAGLGVAVS